MSQVLKFLRIFQGDAMSEKKLAQTGSDWLMKNMHAIPYKNEWIVATGDGIIEHDPIPEKLYERLAAKKINLSNVCIHFNAEAFQ